MTNTKELVEVTQADSDAANKAFDIAFRGDTDGIDEAMGQLFARHRILALESSRPPVAGSGVFTALRNAIYALEFCSREAIHNGATAACGLIADKVADVLPSLRTALATPEPPALEAEQPAFTVRREAANSHCFDDQILADGECIAFASAPWTYRIRDALAALEALRPNAEDVREAGE